MKRFSASLFPGLFLLAMVSCRERIENNVLNKQRFFSLTDLISEQTRYLDNLKVTVNRQSEINGERDEVFFKADSAFWSKEFGIFSSADINKPSLLDRYKIIESDSSGLHFIKYSATEPGINGTAFLSVGRDAEGKIGEINLRVQEKNLIYHSERNMLMNFQANPLSGKNIIKDYRISGYQKIILRKKIQYEIKVSIDWSK